MKKFVCDVCGAVIGDESRNPIALQFGEVNIEADLCDDCAKSVQAWIDKNFGEKND